MMTMTLWSEGCNAGIDRMYRYEEYFPWGFTPAHHSGISPSLQLRPFWWGWWRHVHTHRAAPIAAAAATTIHPRIVLHHCKKGDHLRWHCAGFPRIVRVNSPLFSSVPI